MWYLVKFAWVELGYSAFSVCIIRNNFGLCGQRPLSMHIQAKPIINPQIAFFSATLSLSLPTTSASDMLCWVLFIRPSYYLYVCSRFCWTLTLSSSVVYEALAYVVHHHCSTPDTRSQLTYVTQHIYYFYVFHDFSHERVTVCTCEIVESPGSIMVMNRRRRRRVIAHNTIFYFTNTFAYWEQRWWQLLLTITTTINTITTCVAAVVDVVRLSVILFTEMQIQLINSIWSHLSL